MKCALDASRVLQPTFSFPHTNQQQQQVKIHKKNKKQKRKWINYYKQHTGWEIEAEIWICPCWKTMKCDLKIN